MTTRKSSHRQPSTAGQLTILSLAMTAALAAMAPTAAQAQTVISQNTNSQVAWSSGDLTVNTGVAVSVPGYVDAVYASGSVGTLNNNGAIISGSSNGLSNWTGTISAVVNSGTISSNFAGIYNGRTITALTNNAHSTISGSGNAIGNDGLISTLSNSGTISGSNVYNSGSGTITALTNNANGFIGDAYSALYNLGTIGALSNSGTISANGSGGSGILNANLITTLANTGGTIIAQHDAIGNSGTIGTLDNSGTISGGRFGIYSSASAGSGSNTSITGIGTLSNEGLITGTSGAIYNDVSSTLGPITNSGTIAGNIYNRSTTALTINGGTGTVFGILIGSGSGTGSDNIGTISNSASDLIFGTGNQLLNDNISAGSHTVTNSAGVLQVNNQISITGNYVQNAAATLKIGVGDSAVTSTGTSSDSGYGRLTVSGNATVASGSSIVLAKTGSSYAFATGQRYVIIVASGTGTYNEGSLNYSISGISGATLTGANVSNQLVVSIQSLTSTSSSGLATSGVAKTSLNGLSHYGGTTNGILDLYNASLAISSTSEANRVGEQLSPAQTQNAAAAASSANFGGINVVSSHIDGVRVAQNGSSGVATGENTATWAGWAQLYGGNAHQGVIDSISGYKASYSGLVLGTDRSFGDAWRAGAAFTHSQTSVSGADNLTGNSSHVDAYGLIAYAAYTAQPWYLNLSASALRNNYSSTRLVSLTGFSDVATGSYNGWQYVAKAEAGYPLALAQNVTVTPLASLSMSRLNLNAYTESGSGSALAVQGSSVNAVRSGLGARLEQGIQTSQGQLTPFAQLLWSHQYNDGRMSTTASFAADSTGATSFTTQSAAATRNVAELSLGVNLAKSDDLTLSARYDAQLAQKYDAQTVSVRLQKQF